ncbi:PHB depolymerase family esterase [Chitinimonas viridis]|uniref:PHB depolymerase family esterase n=1 Tax=Chitinimonas viridis TaxID=664880 RepID=A0ABT8AZS4_9NEIS|nr:PHB depolymerase family esterase [Chitinimonas viridis]
MQGLFPEVSRLTAMGRLMDATALIQQTLGGGLTTPAGVVPPFEQARVIEGCFERVDPPKPRAAQRTAGPVSESASSTTTPGHDDLRFIDGSFSCMAGTRSYKLYIPSGHHQQMLPMIVMLHGCTQSPDDFAAGTRMNAIAESMPCIVLYPAQSSQANHTRCWNWFKHADQQRDQGEPAIIAGMTREVIQRYPVDTRRVYVAGLSAGGAMAMVMGATYPDLYAAVGVHSGIPYGMATDLPSALAAMQRGPGSTGSASVRRPAHSTLPMIVFHGDRDTTVHPANGIHAIKQAKPGGAGQAGSAAIKGRTSEWRGQVKGGHRFTVTTHHDEAGTSVAEHWLVHGAGHAWSGGSGAGSYTDPRGPDASQEMVRFFLAHPASQ